MRLAVGSIVRWLRWPVAATLVLIVSLMSWGGRILIADDPPTGPIDGAVVLQGSVAAEKARIAGAVDLLRRGTAGRALISVPKESYWGQSIPPIARAYVEREYGSDIAARIDFCETEGNVDSTAQEAQTIHRCIQERQWQSVVIVTSDYHTRRAGMIWRRVVAADGGKLRVWVEGVKDPEFQQPWWRHRRAAKVFVMECTKLVWAAFGG